MATLLKLLTWFIDWWRDYWRWIVGFDVDAHDFEMCDRCPWVGRSRDLLAGEACPRCYLVLGRPIGARNCYRLPDVARYPNNETRADAHRDNQP